MLPFKSQYTPANCSPSWQRETGNKRQEHLQLCQLQLRKTCRRMPQGRRMRQYRRSASPPGFSEPHVLVSSVARPTAWKSGMSAYIYVVRYLPFRPKQTILIHQNLGEVGSSGDMAWTESIGCQIVVFESAILRSGLSMDRGDTTKVDSPLRCISNHRRRGLNESREIVFHANRDIAPAA